MSAAIDWHGPSRQPCPSCGRNDRDKTLGVTVDAGRGVAHCFRCSYVETLRDDRADIRPGKAIERPVGAPKHERLSEYGRELWNACSRLAGEALAYLLARDCVPPPDDGDLRWHPALKHPISGIAGPALVTLVTDAITGVPLTLHRSWVQANGKKAAVEPARMLLGGHRKAGGVIRLWPDEAVTTGLAVCEGIETALSMAHAYTPAWSCIDAGNLAALPVLAGIECLVIGADHDEAGLRAAQDCADRWAAAGVDVAVVAPKAARADWNDSRRAAA